MKLAALVAMISVGACRDYSVAGPNPYPAPVIAPPRATVVTATGDITEKVEAFRLALGGSNGGAAGEQPQGRREINWDSGALIPLNNRNDFPADFFNNNVTVGTVFTTPGTGFRNDSSLFADINPAYAAQFKFFSARQIFAPIGSNKMDEFFKVAGQPAAAFVSAFGIVFSDVDVAGKTTIQLFAGDGTDLGTYAAPVRSDDSGLSFVGVTFDQPVIARVRITLGTGALAAGVNDISAGGTVDLVVLDNLIFAEPRKPVE
jgi:hypothetical protein